MWSPSKYVYSTPKDLEERHCHTEMRKTGGKSKGAPNEETCGNELCNSTQPKRPGQGDTLSMYPTLQCPRKSHSKPSTMSFLKQGKQWTFNVYKDDELGFNEIADKVIPTKVDEDVKTTTDIMAFGEEICVGDLRHAIDIQGIPNQLYRSTISQGQQSSYSTK